MTVNNYKGLQVINLSAGLARKLIISNINLIVGPGEIHALMGPNGSGKSTLAQVLAGNPEYKLGSDKDLNIVMDNIDITHLSPEDRAKAGLFLSFQNPVGIAGVSTVNLLRSAYQEIHTEYQETDEVRIANPVLQRRWKATNISLSDFLNEVSEMAQDLGIGKDLLDRDINEGFSGGEKKKTEVLQALILKPKYAIFDEIDTGLDVDALKTIADGIFRLNATGCAIMLITHYQRILKYIKPQKVHVMVNGKIVATGGPEFSQKIENEGYLPFQNS